MVVEDEVFLIPHLSPYIMLPGLRSHLLVLRGIIIVDLVSHVELSFLSSIAIIISLPVCAYLADLH